MVAINCGRWQEGKDYSMVIFSSAIEKCLVVEKQYQKRLKKRNQVIQRTMSLESGFGFNLVPASDKTSEWAHNPS